MLEYFIYIIIIVGVGCGYKYYKVYKFNNKVFSQKKLHKLNSLL